MQHYLTFSSILALLACLLVGLLYAWILYRKTQHLTGLTRRYLAAVRIVAVALICWLLFSPLIKTVSYSFEKPVIVIANDNSLSIGNVAAKSFDAGAFKKSLTRLSERLAEKYEVRTYTFSDSVKLGLDFSNQGKLTNAAALAERLTDEFQNRNIGAVIIASDGIFNRGGSPVFELAKLKAPIYTIGMGDTVPKRDVLIASVNYNNIVYLDNDFVVEAQLQAFDSKNERTVLTVTENDKIVHQQELVIGVSSFFKDIPIKLTAKGTGMKKYTMKLTGVKNEITLRNNSFDFFIEVVDGKQDVLVAAAAPHPDIAALRQAIEINRHYKATVAIGEEINNIDLEKFGTVILYQLPAQQDNAANLFQRLKTQKAALWYIVGGQTNIAGFNSVQTKVRYSGATGNTQEVFALQEKRFTPFATEQELERYFQQYDPLIAPFGNVQINDQASAFLLQRIGKIATERPLFFFVEDNGRKVAYLLGEGIWRWRLNESQNEHQFSALDDIVGKTIQYLSVKEDRRKFRVFPARPTFDENENIVINASLYNDSYKPVNVPDVSLKIKNSDGKVFNYTFSKTESGYRLDAGQFSKGYYTYEALVNFGGKLHTATGAFFVNEIIAEYQQTTANHELLRTISGTEGRLFAPSAVEEIEKVLSAGNRLKTVSYEDRKFEDLISLKWVFVLIVSLLTIEWFVRKRAGEA